MICRQKTRVCLDKMCGNLSGLHFCMGWITFVAQNNKGRKYETKESVFYCDADFYLDVVGTRGQNVDFGRLHQPCNGKKHPTSAEQNLAARERRGYKDGQGRTLPKFVIRHGA